MKPAVYITFDVECSMGGARGNAALRPVPPARGMMGQYGQRALGLPLITDILGRSGLAATFFLETFNEEQGYPGGTEAIAAYLLDRRQDVQLHIHPNHKHYAAHLRGEPYLFNDNLADLPAQEQRELLGEGAARLARWTGRPPVAFRAGNMAASEATLPLLAEAGLRIDSSYTFPYAGGQCRFAPGDPYNGSKWYGDVLELALSGFRQPHLPYVGPAKPLDPMGISFEECRDAIRLICGAGADAVIILHSFSLFKVRNVQYDGGKLDWVVTRRFRRLCEWLAARAADYPVRTFAELAAAIADKQYTAKAVPPCKLSTLRGPVRKAVQGLNRLYWV